MRVETRLDGTSLTRRATVPGECNPPECVSELTAYQLAELVTAHDWKTNIGYCDFRREFSSHLQRRGPVVSHPHDQPGLDRPIGHNGAASCSSSAPTMMRWFGRAMHRPETVVTRRLPPEDTAVVLTELDDDRAKAFR